MMCTFFSNPGFRLGDLLLHCNLLQVDVIEHGYEVEGLLGVNSSWKMDENGRFIALHFGVS